MWKRCMDGFGADLGSWFTLRHSRNAVYRTARPRSHQVQCHAGGREKTVLASTARQSILRRVLIPAGRQSPPPQLSGTFSYHANMHSKAAPQSVRTPRRSLRDLVANTRGTSAGIRPISHRAFAYRFQSLGCSGSAPYGPMQCKASPKSSLMA